MSERIVVDPITRIEGHLRVEAQMEGDRIASAYSSGTMVRGIEVILQGRDPRDAWAFAQRICGVCTLVHGLASIRSVENALSYKIPRNADLIRNLMAGAQYIHDHVMHFYHLHALDWVDVVSALDADPKATSELAQSLSSYPKSSPGYFADMQKKLKGFVEAGQLGIFAKAYWGHPAYKLPAEANLMAVSHYLEALSWQRDVARLHTIFGGKNPHPNFVVGGVPCAIDLNSDSAINAKKLSQVQDVINQMKVFVEQVYVPDTLAIASFYKDWGSRGEGLGNFMTYGDFPSNGMEDPSGFMIPAGAILNRDLSTIHEVDMNAADEIQEYVSHSWYDYKDGKDTGLHPYEGETSLNYTGPQPPYEHLDVEQSYSWLKSPRWKGHAMEVGPLARVLMLYASGHEQTKELVNMTPLRARLRPRYSRMPCRAGSMTWWSTSRQVIHAHSMKYFGNHRAGRSKLKVLDSWRRPAVAWPIGLSLKTKSLKTTRPWCPVPGTRAPAMLPVNREPTKRHWKTTTSYMMLSNRWKSFAPFTVSTRVSPVRST
jgi:hydrogenase large subunit